MSAWSRDPAPPSAVRLKARLADLDAQYMGARFPTPSVTTYRWTELDWYFYAGLIDAPERDRLRAACVEEGKRQGAVRRCACNFAEHEVCVGHLEAGVACCALHPNPLTASAEVPR